MDLYKISFEDLQKLIADLLKEGSSVVAQSAEGKEFIEIKHGNEFSLNPASKPSDVSMKEYFFPKSEPLFFYKKTKDEIELIDASCKAQRRVIIGAKPCDAAAVPVISKVFNWDYQDDFFNSKVNNTVIIGTSCRYRDSSCFCTSVGLSPDSEKGSDLFLIPLTDNEYLLKSITEKGRKLLEEFSLLTKNKAEEKPLEENASDKAEFDYIKIKNWLDNNFSSVFWDEPGELCLGCAQCAYVCPTCHCFDIADESCGYSCGKRVKNWDSCQFGLFTKHASGHNPRNDQGKRYRQRINHKFKYYKERFGEILCTGCGRCSRGCPVSINILEILQDIEAVGR